ncbi:dATP/dGTP diphosphohydrolase domain-containing protein [Daeguia caeni]|uniref:dATP/dGTP diphosphohydrolase domain-containing protein n=1 Tax=Daeguia caeni TaxID=439612 RepID=A0ABV9H1U2_9HYPH
MSWERVFAALMRYMWAWWRGDSYDLETGQSHLWHAACCIASLIAYEVGMIGLPQIGNQNSNKPPSNNMKRYGKA